MDNPAIQKKCEEFLASLGLPGFIFFAWEKPVSDKPQGEKDYGFVYAARTFPPQIAMKGLLWAADQMITGTHPPVSPR